MDKPHGKDEVVQAIVLAAIPLIAEKGVKAVTFREVAQAANVNHGLITRHFGTKEGLVAQVTDHLVHLFFDAARLSRPGSMEPLWETITKHRTASKAFARIIQETTPDPISQPKISETLTEVLAWVRTLLGIESDPQSTQANLVIYMLAVLFFGGETFGLHLQAALGLSNPDFLTLRERAFNLVLSGISRAPHP